MSQQGDLTRAQYYELIRGQIEHEDQTINQRVMWQIISQAFFFGAYASLLNAPKEAKNATVDAAQLLLLWGMPLAALSAGILTYLSVVASMRTISTLRYLYKQYADNERRHDPTDKLFPDIDGPAQARRLAILTPLLMPWVFILTWIALLVRLLTAA
jgi:hypothetical protein